MLNSAEQKLVKKDKAGAEAKLLEITYSSVFQSGGRRVNKSRTHFDTMFIETLASVLWMSVIIKKPRIITL